MIKRKYVGICLLGLLMAFSNSQVNYAKTTGQATQKTQAEEQTQDTGACAGVSALLENINFEKENVTTITDEKTAKDFAYLFALPESLVLKTIKKDQ